jgi:hypothetical protein
MRRIFQSMTVGPFGSSFRNYEGVIGEGLDLVHWWRDNSDPQVPWRRGEAVVVGGVAGPGAIIRSNLGSGDLGSLEVVVPLKTDHGQVELWHFTHDNASANPHWEQRQRIASGVEGPGSLIQSTFRAGGHGNFEVVVPQDGSLIHYWHANWPEDGPWQRAQTITQSARGWACLLQGVFGIGTEKNFDVLVEEGRNSVVGYWHANQDVGLPWLRHKLAVVVADPSPTPLSATRKIAQLTGEFDREGWNGQGAPRFAENRTESRFGIRGTDLGSSFEHNGRLYFLFGDTVRTPFSAGGPDDSIAFTTQRALRDGVGLTFHPQPPRVPGISQGSFEVPLDGVSADGRMYVFFSTDHLDIESGIPGSSPSVIMGRSVVARSDNEGLDFEVLYQFSRRKFVNVSIEPFLPDGDDARFLSADPGTPMLLVWGSGRYRSSDVYLATVPMANLETGSNVRFLRWDAGELAWSEDEEDAVPLFCSGGVGELSVRWNPVLQRYLALFNMDNPRGILMHSAPKPWGPWSDQSVLVFDPGYRSPGSGPCEAAGYGRFMHIPWTERRCDHVQDDMFGPRRDNEWGGEYGPYQVPSFAEREGMGSRIYFVMSTWNPYQVMLMTSVIDLQGST